MKCGCDVKESGGVNISLGRIQIRQYTCKQCGTLNKILTVPPDLTKDCIVEQLEKLQKKYPGERPEHVKCAVTILNNRLAMMNDHHKAERQSVSRRREDLWERQFLSRATAEVYA